METWIKSSLCIGLSTFKACTSAACGYCNNRKMFFGHEAREDIFVQQNWWWALFYRLICYMEKELFKKVTNDAVVRHFYENGRKRTEIWPNVRQSFFLFFLECMILSFLCLKLTCSFSFSLSRDDLEYFGQLWHAILAILSCDVNWFLDLYNSGEACRYIFFSISLFLFFYFYFPFYLFIKFLLQ